MICLTSLRITTTDVTYTFMPTGAAAEYNRHRTSGAQFPQVDKALIVWRVPICQGFRIQIEFRPGRLQSFWYYKPEFPRRKFCRSQQPNFWIYVERSALELPSFSLSIPPFMASALHSNSFLLTTSPHSRLTLRTPRLTIFAKKAGPFPPFRLGRASDSSASSEDESSSNGSVTKSRPFSFNFGKIPDVKSLVPAVSQSPTGLSFINQRRKDSGTVFVAGATGQAGIRIAQTLLRQGFSVRAGVPELGAAQDLARLAASYKIISSEESKRLTAVESSFQNAQAIAKAIGNASKVVVTIGPAENGPTSEISAFEALQVIEAADLAGVAHVVIVYDGNSTSVSTYNVLDGISLFFNNLFSQSNQSLSIPELLQKVVQMDIRYTFIKTRLTEDFSPESTYNIVVAAEGKTNPDDYKVAKSRIASLVANVFSNTAVAENKVVEVFSSPGAPLIPVDELFSAIPEDGRRKAFSEVLAKAKAEEEAAIAAAKAKQAAEAARKLEEEVVKLSEQEAVAASLAEEAQEKAQAAGASVESFMSRAKDIKLDLSWEKFSSQITNAIPKPDFEIPKVQIATVRGQAKARTLPANKAVVKPTPNRTLNKPKEEVKQKGKVSESKTERNVFGGLFKQEIIYMNDD